MTFPDAAGYKRAMRPALLVLALSLLSTSIVEAKGGDWEELFEDDGITVWRRQVEGSDFVEFRGRGVLPADIRNLSAIIRDNLRKKEWMHQCADDFAIQYLGPFDIVIYNKTASGVFFIRDRDTVLRAVAKVMPETKTIQIDFWNVKHPKMPEVDGVVRMPKLVGHWLLEALGPKSTRVTYQVQADPGGALPAWLVNAVSKNIPWHTIANLGKQSKKTGYKQQLLILDQLVDWSRFGLPFEPFAATSSAAAAAP